VSFRIFGLTYFEGDRILRLCHFSLQLFRAVYRCPINFQNHVPDMKQSLLLDHPPFKNSRYHQILVVIHLHLHVRFLDVINNLENTLTVNPRGSPFFFRTPTILKVSPVMPFNSGNNLEMSVFTGFGFSLIRATSSWHSMSDLKWGVDSKSTSSLASLLFDLLQRTIKSLIISLLSLVTGFGSTGRSSSLSCT
jgi:hypothetical protein